MAKAMAAVLLGAALLLVQASAALYEPLAPRVQLLMDANKAAMTMTPPVDARADGAAIVTQAAASFVARHTNNWAVLVCTSRFWFNYRHIANVLSMYNNVKRLGIPDSNIILMLPDDIPCNPRNVFPGAVYNNPNKVLDLYGDDIEVDYRGYEVTVENFLRVMTDRVSENVPRSKRLLTDDTSNILVYMTGHGGDEFLKFQDAEELSSYDLAHTFEQMWQKRRYNEILFVIDTCQANTMFKRFYSPNILAVGSAALGENSYAHHHDDVVGVAVIDRFTNANLEFIQRLGPGSTVSLKALFDSYSPQSILSHPEVRTDLFRRPLHQVRVTDFFGAVQAVELLPYVVAVANHSQPLQGPAKASLPPVPRTGVSPAPVTQPLKTPQPDMPLAVGATAVFAVLALLLYSAL